MSTLTAPPTGTVTFLFTDIAGSTRLWEMHPDAMQDALARHDTLLRNIVQFHQGHVVKTTGDGLHAAFATAPQALHATLTAQRTLQTQPWQPPLAVRMGLHTGTAESRDADYYGPALNRAARLMAAGHGGQVLLSAATQELVRDHLPEGAGLLELGQHRLKDLGRPEQVYQLLHPDLPAAFPPLRSLDNPALPNNLPQQVTSFIGREKEVAEIKALLGKTRLLTLTGAGGAGKTRLSLQVAADLLDGEGDGVWLVELAALSDPALVVQAVADVLGIKEQAGQTIQQTLVAALKPKRLLLVLDNCEHLVGACASLASDLLRSCPGVRILASSREALNVAGEQAYRVPSLSLPDPRQAQTLESVSQFEAVRLFIDRSLQTQPSFQVTNENAPAVAQVCFRLDGIPLAIELAAARVRSLSVEQINVRLDQRFRLLTGGSRTALPRQQTLRSLIDWSYDLLTESEKVLLCRLSVFAGGWTLAAAEAICAGDRIEEWEVLDLLTGLVDKSLVGYEEEGRYRLLETVRRYAGDRLTESGGAETIQGRAASYFLRLAEEAEPHLMGPEQVLWLGRLETEHENLRASLAWYEQQPEGAEAGLRLAGALWRFWKVRGHLSEGRQWLSRTLKRGQEDTAETAPSAAQARALNGAGNLADLQGDYDQAQALFEKSLILWRQLADQEGIAGALGNLGGSAARHGDYAAARVLYEESLTVFRGLGNQRVIAALLSNLSSLAFWQGDYARARALDEESLGLQRKMGDQWSIALLLNNLGKLAILQDDYAEAQTLFEESLTLRRQLRDQSGIAHALADMGSLADAQGDYARARTLFGESLVIHRQMGDQQGIADALANLGLVASNQKDNAQARVWHGESLAIQRQMGDQRGIAFNLERLAVIAHGRSQLSQAARLLGAATFLRENIGSPRSPGEQEEMGKLTASVRAALGEEAYAAAWESGRAMTLEQAVEYALLDASA